MNCVNIDNQFENIWIQELEDDGNASHEILVDNENHDSIVYNDLQKWAISFNMSHSALRDLLKIWNNRLPGILPKDPRSLLRTPVNIILTEI